MNAERSVLSYAHVPSSDGRRVALLVLASTAMPIGNAVSFFWYFYSNGMMRIAFGPGYGHSAWTAIVQLLGELIVVATAAANLVRPRLGGMWTVCALWLLADIVAFAVGTYVIYRPWIGMANLVAFPPDTKVQFRGIVCAVTIEAVMPLAGVIALRPRWSRTNE